MFIEMTQNEKRRLLRIAFGSTLGFVVCKLMNWPYGVFFTVYPMLLMGMVPVFNRTLAIGLVLGVAINVVEFWFLKVFLTSYPIAMMVATFFIFAYHFRFMLTSNHYLMWASGLITLSVLLNFGSYDTTNFNDLVMAAFLSSGLSVVSAYLLYWLFPDRESPTLPQKPTFTPSQVNHRMFMGALLATLSFVTFQVFNLKGSLSAQVATILVLFPMTYQGSIQSAKSRAAGVAYGCTLGILVQIALYSLIEHFLLVTMALFITVMITAYFHIAERVGSGIGFGALTTIGILFGQYMKPDSDILYSSLYRFSSVTVALLLVLMSAYIIDAFLNRFEWTKNH